MLKVGPISVGSYVRAGRLVPSNARVLHARSIVLERAAVMDWHSTQDREELLCVMRGWVQLEAEVGSGRIRRVRLLAGQCAFLGEHVRHRVVNRSGARARYLYVTGSTQR